MCRLTTPESIIEYLTGGYAEFTIKSIKTGNHFSYKTAKMNSNAFFVSVLTGPDNEHDFSYLGLMPASANRLIRTKATPANSVSFVALDWLLKNVSVFNVAALRQVEVHHTGKCSRCGRKLTTPESIKRGIGPVCLERNS